MSAEPRDKQPVGFKPRPKLFWTLLVIFVLWLAALLTLYLTVVYPRRHGGSH